jgi:hypothetical protein
MLFGVQDKKLWSNAKAMRPHVVGPGLGYGIPCLDLQQAEFYCAAFKRAFEAGRKSLRDDLRGLLGA